jgi:hypothetical protein
MPQSTKKPPKFINPPAYLALEGLSHDPKLAEALGNMVVAWAHAEIMLFATFARVTEIGLNMAMESSARIPTFESRTKFIFALLQEWETDEFDKDAISAAVDGLAKLARTRNHWVHGDWCAKRDKSETVIFDHRALPDSPRRKKPVKAHDVMNHCDAVKSRAAQLAKLVKYEQLEA